MGLRFWMISCSVELAKYQSIVITEVPAELSSVCYVG